MKTMDYAALPELAQNYLDYLLTVKGKSELTVQGYALDLLIYFRFLMRRKKMVSQETPFDNIQVSGLTIDTIGSVNLDDAHAFLTYCKRSRGNDAAALARKSVAIKRFYRFLALNHEDRMLKENPLRDLESPKIRKTLPKYLTLEQSRDLLQVVDGNFRERDYCILTLFLNCGLRLSELVQLNLTDIRPDDTLRVVGKGNKERTIYLNDACKAALQNYLRVRPADGIQDRSALFISRNRKRISVRAVQNVVDKFLEKAGLAGQGYSVHKLRHTAATLMYQHGHVDVLLLKEILGHENLSTTEIYTHVVNAQLREAVEANPLNSASSSPADDQSK